MGFEYLRPTEWAEASRLVAEPGAVAKMGGCDVLTRFRGGRLQADVVVGLDRIRGTRELRFDDGAVTMGAGVTLADLERSAMFARRFPTIARVVRDIASPAIRHQASVIGNVAQGWDVGDLVPLLQVLDATLELVGPSGSRTMSVAEYARLRGHASLAPGELITTLAISTPGHAFRLGYERFAFKDSFELPLVAAAVGGRVEKGVARDVRVALVGTGPMPARSTPAEVSHQ